MITPRHKISHTRRCDCGHVIERERAQRCIDCAEAVRIRGKIASENARRQRKTEAERNAMSAPQTSTRGITS